MCFHRKKVRITYDSNDFHSKSVSLKTPNRVPKTPQKNLGYCGECMITLSLPRSGACNLAILNCAPVFAPRLLRCACDLGMQYCQVFF